MRTPPRTATVALAFALTHSCAVRGTLLTERDARADTPVTDSATEAGEACGAPADTSAIHSISSGQSHSCRIRAGVLSCWGANNEGALGTGDTTDRNAPAELSGSRRWLAVAAAAESTCAIDDRRAVWCWGANGSGQLATADTAPRSAPTRAASLCDARAISGTFDHFCALTGDARLYCWGRNDEGQLGQSDQYPGRNATEPVEVLPSGAWRAVATGQGHTCAIREPGALYCWGRNTEGQLALGAGTPIQVRTPTRVAALDGWTALSAGQDQSCALRMGGELYCWGSGSSIAGGTARTPARVGVESDWIALSVSTFAACATRSATRALYCWGRNDEGQLGIGSTVSQPAPTLVTLSSAAATLALGRFYSCLLGEDTQSYCTGENARGQLGVGDLDRRARFTLVR